VLNEHISCCAVPFVLEKIDVVTLWFAEISN
jgi:hypothetical protein